MSVDSCHSLWLAALPVSVDRVFTGPHPSECALGCYSAKGGKPGATHFGVGGSHTVVRQPRARARLHLELWPFSTRLSSGGAWGVLGVKKSEVVVTAWRSVGGL